MSIIDNYVLYEELFRKDVSLVFLREPYISTETYKKALAGQISLTGDKVNLILKGVNRYLMELEREQIRIAFGQAEKEVSDLHQRIWEGNRDGAFERQTGHPKGTTYETRKAKEAKKVIRKHNKSFGGSLTDAETMRPGRNLKEEFL